MKFAPIDLSNVTPDTGYEPVPAGNYNVITTAAEVRTTKAGDGQYLNLEMQIEDGEYAGRLVWARLNLWSASEKAQDIARRQAASILLAGDRPMSLDDEDQLIGIELKINVALRQDEGWGPANDVKRFQARDTSKAPARAAPAAAPAARSGPPVRGKVKFGAA
jgi:hypothetical protein